MNTVTAIGRFFIAWGIVRATQGYNGDDGVLLMFAFILIVSGSLLTSTGDKG